MDEVNYKFLIYFKLFAYRLQINGNKFKTLDKLKIKFTVLINYMQSNIEMQIMVKNLNLYW